MNGRLFKFKQEKCAIVIACSQQIIMQQIELSISLLLFIAAVHHMITLTCAD